MIYDISYKTLIGPKVLRIRFNNIDGSVRVHDGTGCLVLFGSEKYYVVYNRIKYVISLKSSITNVFSHYML